MMKTEVVATKDVDREVEGESFHDSDHP